MNADLVFTPGDRFGFDQDPVPTPLKNTDMGQGRQAGSVDPSGAVLENRDRAVEGERRWPVDRRPLDQGYVSLVDFPFRKTLRE